MDFAEIFAEEVGARAHQELLSCFEFMKVRCESPIEEVMLVALLAQEELCPEDAALMFQRRNFEFGDPKPAPFTGAFIFSQAKVGDYRADFLFDIWSYDVHQTLVVECDGHEFHERTKEQAARDRKRDRWMTEQGIIVLRFTGSEIWADPGGCAGQVVDMFIKLLIAHGTNSD